MAVEFDFLEGLDPTPLGSISASQLLQMIRQAEPIDGRGLVIAGPTAPDVVNNPRFTRYLWKDESTNPPIIRFYNTNTSSWEAGTVTVGSVNTASIQDGAVTPIKIQPGPINTYLITNNAGNVAWSAFTLADGSIALSKIDKGSGNDGRLLRITPDGSAIEWFDLNAGDYLTEVDPAIITPSGLPLEVLMINAEGTFPGFASVLTAIAEKSVPITKLTPHSGLAYLRTKADGTTVEWGTSPTAVVQRVIATTNVYSTITSIIPFDDTIPQQSPAEGSLLLSVAITPQAATNILVVEAEISCSVPTANVAVAALFQDSVVNAIAATYQSQVEPPNPMRLIHQFSPGSIASTTLKLHVGSNDGSAVEINGALGARKFGGVLRTILTITEYAA